MTLIKHLFLWVSLLTVLVNSLPRIQYESSEDGQQSVEFIEAGNGNDTAQIPYYRVKSTRDNKLEESFDVSDDKDIHTTSRVTISGPQIYFLSQGRLGGAKSLSGSISRMSTEGGAVTTVLSDLNHAPDGIAVDKAAGYIYFSNMRPGSIQRCRLDGSDLVTLVKGFKVGKQVQLVNEGGAKKLYWTDREGMKVMRSNIDGSDVEILVDTSKDTCSQPECKWAVGIAVDQKNGFVYWSQKSRGGHGSIKRAPIRFKNGQSAKDRTDVQTVLKGLPEPIDLSWVDGFGLYWTDRAEGNAEGGNSVNNLRMSEETMSGVEKFERHKVLVKGLKSGIGIAVDAAGSHRMWFTDLAGHVYRAKLDGTEFVTLTSGHGLVVGMDFVA